MSLSIGSKIANFSLPNHLGQTVSLADFKGQWVLIYFYPKAATPGCTTQACGLRDSLSAFNAVNAQVLGISPDPVAKLAKFHQAQGLNFPLLSDEDHALAEAFGVWALKKFMGKTFMGIVRTSFILNPEGTLVAVLDDFKTASHHETALASLKTLQAG
jgi:thioredoxin-dependent peroxiredoxin